MSATSKDYHLNMFVKHHAEHYAADGLSNQEAELRKLQLMRKMSVRVRSFKSPVSPLQFDYIGSPHNQHDESFVSNSSFSSKSWSSEEQSSPCNKRQIDSVHAATLQSPSKDSGDVPESSNFALAPSSSGAPSLIDASSALHASLTKAHCIQKQVEVFSNRVEHAMLRLPALELAMAPMSSDLADTKELCGFVDQTTGPALAVLKAFETVQKLTPVIKAGPANDKGLGIYLGQVSSLESLLRFLRGKTVHVVQLLQGAVEMLGETRVINKLSLCKFKETLSCIGSDSSFHERFGAELLEYAVTHLESQFTNILSKDARIIKLHTDSVGSPCKNMALMPEASLYSLQTIAKKLSSYGKLNQCLCLYENAREVVIRKSLKTLGASAQYLRHSTPEAVQALEWETLEDNMSIWVQQMELVIKILLFSERKLISHVFDQCGISENRLQWQACFVRLALKAALQHWLKFGVAVARSSNEPQKLFKLLDMLECVEGLRGPIEEDVLNGDACKRARLHVVALQRELMNGASKVLKAFGSQVGEDKDAPAPLNGGVMKLVSYVVNYVKCLLGESYRPLIERVMQTGAGNDDQLKTAMLHLMQALERNIEAKAKGLQDIHPALGQLFLMNNHWYIYMRLKNTHLATILGIPWLKQHKQRSEKCAMRYQQEAWGSLLCILRGPDGLLLSLGNNGVRRTLLQERLLEFNNAFAEVYRLHESWSVPDSLLRPQLGITVLHSFVPMLSALLGQLAPFLPPAQHMEYTPRRVQQMIAALFDVPEAKLKPPTPLARGVPAKLHTFH